MTQGIPARLEQLIPICLRAGDEIMAVYGGEIEVDQKADESPLTEADRRAHRSILADLAELDPSIPIVSEESDPASTTQRREWRQFWLVDPLDGTKEFIKRNGEFTVNIALIEDSAPVLGAVWAPALGEGFLGVCGSGAWRFDKVERHPIATQVPCNAPIRIVGSRSHRGNSLDDLLAAIGPHELVAIGSSLKICRIASGEADFYPRLGPTSEWDTAAAHAVLEAAGGQVVDLDGDPLRYNKEDILNPYFLAFGDSSRNWPHLVRSSDG